MSARTGFAFTPHDTPDLRARVEHDLARVVDAVTDRDPGAWSIVLTGGFSRGEGTALADRPVNDYDLVVFRRARPVRTRAYAELPQRLEDELGLHIDLLPVWRGRIRALRPKVFWYDLKHGGRVLWGAPDVLERIPVNKPDEIPADEAARLLGNRAVGLLEAVPGPDAKPDPDRVHLQASKALLAAGEALLILEGKYAPSYRERERRLRALLPKLRPRFPQAEDVVRLHAWATAWKLQPDAYGRDDAERLWGAARRALLLVAAHAWPRAGWGQLDAYPRQAPWNPVEAAFHAARDGVHPPPRLIKPSHEARALGLRLLEHATFPAGTDGRTPEVRRAFERAGLEAPTTWQETLRALLEFRATTLQ